MLRYVYISILILLTSVSADGQTVHKNDIYQFVGRFEKVEFGEFIEEDLIEWAIIPISKIESNSPRDIGIEFARRKQLNNDQRSDVYSNEVLPDYDLYVVDSSMNSNMEYRF